MNAKQVGKRLLELKRRGLSQLCFKAHTDGRPRTDNPGKNTVAAKAFA